MIDDNSSIFSALKRSLTLLMRHNHECGDKKKRTGNLTNVKDPVGIISI